MPCHLPRTLRRLTGLLLLSGPLLAGEPAAVDRIDQGLDWQRCSTAIAPAPARHETPPPAIRIQADGVSHTPGSDLTRLSGDVRLDQGERHLEAEQIDYHPRARSLDIDGSLYLEQPGLRLSGQRGFLDLDDDHGWLEQAEFRLPQRPARGRAERIELLDRQRSRQQRVSYTSCRPGREDWLIEADQLELDLQSGWGTARDASLSLGGVPVFYTPYLTFPLDDRRKSGLLIPTLGSSSRGGAELSIPYYFNLAPNYDATLTPRIMSRRGVMLGGEFRYLGESHSGELTGEYIDDGDYPGGRQRGAFHLSHRASLAPGLSSRIDLGRVSDDDYLADFGGGLAITSTRHIEQLAQLDYRFDQGSLLARLQSFQTVDPTIAVDDRPYRRLPQLLARYQPDATPLGSRLDLEAEYVRFDHESRVRGQRVALAPSLSLPLRRSWGHLTPRVGLDYAGYRLEGSSGDASPSRLATLFSLDSGLLFERQGDNGSTQTLEPRIHYLYVPYEEQGDIPVFDSAAIDLTYDSLFLDNRFSGRDRVGDANQLALGLTSRLLDRRGVERLRTSIGQIVYFDDRRVQLDDSPPQTTGSSALVAELEARLSENWRLDSTLRWDPHRSGQAIDKGRFSLRYSNPRRQLIGLDYRYTRDSIEDLDLSTYWPFSRRFGVVAEWRHSLLHRRAMNQIAGFEYGGRCCWRLRGLFQRYVTDAESAADNRFMLQLELTGLGRLGNDIEQTLEENIRGYRQLN